MGERKFSYRVWRGNLKERSRFEDLDADGMIILKWILKK